MLNYYKHTYINSAGEKIHKFTTKPWATYSKNKNFLEFIDSQIVNKDNLPKIKEYKIRKKK